MLNDPNQPKPRAPNRVEEPDIVELDGPPQAFFELPLDYWATPNGELERAGAAGSARLIQRVMYINFKVADNARCQTVIERVKARLRDLGGGYIWWRLRPTYTLERELRFRLGTTPQLPDAWWNRLSEAVGNGSLDRVPGVPGD